VKHGALSEASGRVGITWELDGGPAGRLRLRWSEEGGPPVQGAPGWRGFGTRLLEGAVRGQLGGGVSLAWKASGLVCEVEVPLARNARASVLAAD